MSGRSIGLSEELHAYLMGTGVREPEVLARLRVETAALPEARMQIAPEEGAFLAMLVRLTGAKRCLEIGTFTGYSSTAMALALPADGHLVCCDVSREWTDVARRTWDAAGVTDREAARAHSTWPSSMPTSRTTTPTWRAACASCGVAALSSSITSCGAGVWQIHRIPTSPRWRSEPSTPSSPATSGSTCR